MSSGSLHESGCSPTLSPAQAARREEFRGDDVEAREMAFLRLLAHDARGMLGVTSLALETLSDPGATRLNNQEIDSLQTAKENVLYLIEALASVSDACKLETGELTSSPTMCDISRMLNEQIAALQPILQRRQITVDAHQEEISLACDPLLMQRVLRILLVHVIRFTPRGRTVQINLVERNGYAEFTAGNGLSGAGCGRNTSVRMQGAETSADSRKPALPGIDIRFCNCVIAAHDGELGWDVGARQGRSFWFHIPCGKRGASDGFRA